MKWQGLSAISACMHSLSDYRALLSLPASLLNSAAHIAAPLFCQRWVGAPAHEQLLTCMSSLVKHQKYMTTHGIILKHGKAKALPAVLITNTCGFVIVHQGSQALLSCPYENDLPASPLHLSDVEEHSVHALDMPEALRCRASWIALSVSSLSQRSGPSAYPQRQPLVTALEIKL